MYTLDFCFQICAQVLTADILVNTTLQEVPYLVKNDQWIGFDDQNSIRTKVRFTPVNIQNKTTKDNDYSSSN